MDNLSDNKELFYAKTEDGKLIKIENFGFVPSIEIDDEMYATNLEILSMPLEFTAEFECGYTYKPSKCKNKKWNSIQKDRAMLQYHWLLKRIGAL